ncbi:MAG: phosphatidylserine decarboxylase [Bacteroidota bacterium]
METSSYYSDPSFTVLKVPDWRAKIYGYISISLWGRLPSTIQRRLSKFYASIYNKHFSKYIIRPYLYFNYSDKDYLTKFKPPNGKLDYGSFQDFFTREFQSLPSNTSDWVWPCEGLLCDEGKLNEIKSSYVKCDLRYVHTIFGVQKTTIPPNYTFTNVFLHNKNYHRIHAPIHGTVTRIQHIPGDLIVLRPWIYKQNPSLPAFRNERYNIDIADSNGNIWYLSIVGGPAVGTIALEPSIQVGEKVDKLQEVALFYLGSTCCMASPLSPRFHTKNTFVEVGASY